MFHIESICSNKIYVTGNLKFVLGRVENRAGEGENAGSGYQHFLLYPQCFQMACFEKLKIHAVPLKIYYKISNLTRMKAFAYAKFNTFKQNSFILMG